MKINGIPTPGTTAPSRPVARGATERPAGPADADVHLSKASAGLGAQPPVDTAKVQEIRQAIKDGRFVINSSAIADRLITSARELVDSHRQA